MGYVELKCCTHYSFLRGSSTPAELVDQAAKLGLRGLAITDRNGVYGIPKAYLALKEQRPDFKLIVGAELTLSGLEPITLIAQDRKAYGALCRIITASHADKPKGEAVLEWSQFLELLRLPGTNGLIALPQDHDLLRYGDLKDIFGERVFLPLTRHLDHQDAQRTKRALEISRRYEIPIVATNDVHFHAKPRRKLQDVMTAIREGKTLKDAGYLLFSNAERYLKSSEQIKKLFKDMPDAVTRTLEVAERCTFSPGELRYRYPTEWIPGGYTAQSYLTELVWKGAQKRYPGGTPLEVREQLEHELKLIGELSFADYFLTIWEMVDFARSRGILCQGRGSAANSAVCFVLEITSVDPVKMKLLFERFISAERGEPPDIDVDFEHERREEVIQYIYQKYGRDRAAMVSAVRTYRSRSAIREVSKVFGREMDKRSFEKLLEKNPTPSGKVKAVTELSQEIRGFPRHLSIHSGGFTLSADPMIEIVPVEPARMDGRTIVQWDKYDLDILGLLKVDVLALGMLTALKKTLELVGGGLTLATLPQDDPKTYQMIRKADTIGVFQIESRAQMSMLPRLLPENFYDLVVEVALVRPGPIVGNMVHPYLKRRRGLEPVSLPDPRLEPILGRTMGVPLFQEQVMKMAITLAGFTPGEADELRRATGAWRSSGSVDKIGRKLMQGLLKNGLPQSFADLIFSQIQGFAEYGFPESHAASFALLVYASCYLKCHYPAQFACALLNSYPLGFYAPHTIVDDAKRHGVQVYPLDPGRSDWDCEMENGGLRLGWRYVQGIQRTEAQSILDARAQKPFTTLGDFLSRTRLRSNVLHRLAMGDVFKSFGYSQRAALWQILEQDPLLRPPPGAQLNLFDALTAAQAQPLSPFKKLSDYEEICADYSVFGLSTRGHPMRAVRARFPKLPRTHTALARKNPHGRIIEVPGISVVMQRPPTAKGTVFATIEDEYGFLDLIFHPDIFQKYRDQVLENSFLIVRGLIQRDGESVSMIVRSVRPFIGVDEGKAEQDSGPRVRTSRSEGVYARY